MQPRYPFIIVDKIAGEGSGSGFSVRPRWIESAIKAWSDREIFDVQVTLEVIDAANRDGETVITAKVDGTFDRTSLPHPLILVHHIVSKDDKIVRLRCRLGSETAST